jgi:hypothetical protein
MSENKMIEQASGEYRYDGNVDGGILMDLSLLMASGDAETTAMAKDLARKESVWMTKAYKLLAGNIRLRHIYGGIDVNSIMEVANELRGMAYEADKRSLLEAAAKEGLDTLRAQPDGKAYKNADIGKDPNQKKYDKDGNEIQQ